MTSHAGHARRKLPNLQHPPVNMIIPHLLIMMLITLEEDEDDDSKEHGDNDSKIVASLHRGHLVFGAELLILLLYPTVDGAVTELQAQLAKSR